MMAFLFHGLVRRCNLKVASCDPGIYHEVLPIKIILLCQASSMQNNLNNKICHISYLA